MAGISLGEFFIKIGQQVDFAGFDKIDRSLVGLEKSSFSINKLLNSWPTKIIAAYVAIDKLVQYTSQLYINAQNIGIQTGLNEQAMLEVQNIARQANPNVNAQEVLGSLTAIQQKLVQIKYLGGGNFKPFQMLGIGNIAGKNAIDILNELREIARRPMNQGPQRAVFTQLAEQVGISPGMINMLYMSDQAYNKAKKLAIIHEKDQEVLKETRYDFVRVNIELGYLIDSIVAGLSPYLKWIPAILEKIIDDVKILKDYIGKFSDWLGEHKELLIGIKLAILGILTFLFPVSVLCTTIGLAIDDIITQLNGGKGLFSSPMKQFIDYIYDRCLIIAALMRKIQGNNKAAGFLIGQLSDPSEQESYKEALGLNAKTNPEANTDYDSGIFNNMMIGIKDFMNDSFPYIINSIKNNAARSVPMYNPAMTSYSPTMHNTYYITGENGDGLAAAMVNRQQGVLNSTRNQFFNMIG